MSSLNGNTSRVRQLATEYELYDGALKVWYLPYIPAIFPIINGQLRTAVPDDEWDSQHGMFAILASFIVDIEVVDSECFEAKAVGVYWECKQGGNPLVDYQLMVQILSIAIMNELFAGYEETRAKLPPAPEETQEERPAKDSPLEESGTKPKKRRGKKHTEPIS